MIIQELDLAIKTIYNLNGLKIDNILQEKVNAEYGAYSFKLNNKNIKFRVAKITPKKLGQFVAFYKRTELGPIEPYNTKDVLDLLIIYVQDKQNVGQFIFPKTVLEQKNIISTSKTKGKLGFRVYPPWVKLLSPIAQKTQDWQLLYFCTIKPEIDLIKIKSYF